MDFRMDFRIRHRLAAGFAMIASRCIRGAPY
jgi:hypothetical protein